MDEWEVLQLEALEVGLSDLPHCCPHVKGEKSWVLFSFSYEYLRRGASFTNSPINGQVPVDVDGPRGMLSTQKTGRGGRWEGALLSHGDVVDNRTPLVPGSRT